MTDEQGRTLIQINLYLDSHPEDFHTRLVLADLLSELGDPLEVLERYLARVQKHPQSFVHRGTGQRIWLLGRSGNRGTNLTDWTWSPCCVEERFFGHLESDEEGWKSTFWSYYTSRESAEANLLKALQREYPELFRGDGDGQALEGGTSLPQGHADQHGRA